MALARFWCVLAFLTLAGCGIDDQEFTLNVNEDINACIEQFEEPCAVVAIPISQMEYVEAILSGDVVR